jgi:hypothetical protein
LVLFFLKEQYIKAPKGVFWGADLQNPDFQSFTEVLLRFDELETRSANVFGSLKEQIWFDELKPRSANVFGSFFKKEQTWINELKPPQG